MRGELEDLHRRRDRACESLLRLNEQIGLALETVADVGDLAVVFQSGAYGASASPQGFLGHPGCVEVLV